MFGLPTEDCPDRVDSEIVASLRRETFVNELHSFFIRASNFGLRLNVLIMFGNLSLECSYDVLKLSVIVFQ